MEKSMRTDLLDSTEYLLSYSIISAWRLFLPIKNLRRTDFLLRFRYSFLFSAAMYYNQLLGRTEDIAPATLLIGIVWR